jgi:hypothetical protein
MVHVWIGVVIKDAFPAEEAHGSEFLLID